MKTALIAATAAFAGLWTQAALAADPTVETAPIEAPAIEPVLPDQAFFGFAGRATQNTLGEAFVPFNVEWDDITEAGVGYQKFIKQLPLNVRFGYEVGVAGRFGEESKFIPGNTAEFWAGGLLRYDGFSLFNTVRVAASATFGFSAVTDTTGYERQREIAKDGDATFLFFLAPEVSLSLEDHRNFEVFARIQHRSGGDGTINNMRETYNVPVVGVRLFF